MLDEWLRKVDGSDEKKGLAMWNKWGRYVLVGLVCIGLLALMWPSSKNAPVKNVAVQKSEVPSDSVRASLAGELQSILSQVDGAGKVEVSLMLNSNGVKTYASNTKNESKQTQEMDKNSGERSIREDNLASDIAVLGGAPILVEDKAPKVTGVLIVADGARDAAVKEELTDAAVTLLNISPHQVRVVPRGVVTK